MKWTSPTTKGFPVDEILSALFAQTLGLDGYGPDEDFFDRGGQSVSAMLLLSRINESQGTDLALADLFAAPTPARLGRRIAELHGRAAPAAPAQSPSQSQARTRAQTDAATDERIPLSPCQEFFCLIDLGSEVGAFGSRHLIANSWWLTGRVDVPALQRALDDVVERHEILRTELNRTAEPRYQVVRPASPVALSVVDIPAGEADRDQAAVELAARASTEPFDVSNLPLLRATLGRFGPESSLLVLTAHHSAADAWSTQVLMRDIAAYYAVHTGHASEPDLPPLRQYREHALRQAALTAEQGPDPEKLAGWRDRLAGAEAFTLETRPPASLDPARSVFGAYNFAVPTQSVQGVLRLAGETSSTPYMVMLTAFYLMANAFGGGVDLTVTTFNAGRDDPDFRDTVGLFINMLAIRADLSGVRTFREAILRTRAACLETFSNELPFGEIAKVAPDLFGDEGVAEKIAPAFEMVQSPLRNQTGQAGDLGFREAYFTRTVDDDAPDLAAGMLWVVAMTSPTDCIGTVQYKREEFSLKAVAEFVDTFLSILGRCVADPDKGPVLQAR